MSSEESADKESPDAADPDADGAEGNGGAEAAAAPAEPSLEDKLNDALASAKQNREKMLRVAADFENFRKRSQREVDDAHRRGMQVIVKDLLTVFDNLERATAVTEDTSVESLSEGLRIVQRQFLDLIGKRGIERIVALGQPFDPTLHEAIQYDVSDEYEAGLVMLVLQPGYKMGEQLLRPALVMVSRGKAEAAPAASPAASGDGPSEPADGDGGDGSE